MKWFKVALLIFFTSPIWGLFVVFCIAVVSDDTPPTTSINENSYYENRAKDGGKKF